FQKTNRPLRARQIYLNRFAFGAGKQTQLEHSRGTQVRNQGAKFGSTFNGGLFGQRLWRKIFTLNQPGCRRNGTGRRGYTFSAFFIFTIVIAALSLLGETALIDHFEFRSLSVFVEHGRLFSLKGRATLSLKLVQ